MSGNSFDKPIQLIPIFRERVWGRESLEPYFPVTPRNQRIGEVWYTAEENLTSLDRTLGDLIREHPEMLGAGADPEHPGICPLLLKLVLTNERLSVQVHPDNEYAREHHRSLGKTEAWYVLEAQPGATIGVGFREALSRDRLREAAQSGEIEQLLHWREVAAGDAIYVSAGTVHAIGAGLTICEIQENSDITYRLYDYGRGRELHLKDGIAVARLGSHEDGAMRLQIEDWREQLVECPYFRIERIAPRRPIQVASKLPCYLILICVKGSGRVAEKDVKAGQAWLIPAGGASCILDGPGSEWILTYTADEPIAGLREE